MDYATRLKNVRHLIDTLSCDALLVDQPVDLFYLTGLKLSAGKLVISQKESCLIVDGRYKEQSEQQKIYPVFLQKETTFLDCLKALSIRCLGFDKDKTTYQGFLNLQQIGKQLNIETIPLEAPVQQMRLIKDADEIHCLRAAAQLDCEGYAFVVSHLKEHITEAELAFELEFFWKKRGGEQLSFDPIIAFGPSSSMPHYRAGQGILKAPTSVLVDIGVRKYHYHSDLTRVHFWGEPAIEMQKIYAIVKEAKERAMALCRPGTLIGDLDRIAREWITTQGYGAHFTHSLGHGVGLEIHEPPILRSTGPYSLKPLQAGMVITIEPGIYLPERGGVRLEDTLLITEEGYENLTEQA